MFLLFLQQEDGNILEGKYGEFWFEFNSGSLFSVTKYEGFEDRHYVCLHSSSLNLYHQGKGGIKVAVGAKFETRYACSSVGEMLLPYTILFPPSPPRFLSSGSM